MIYATMGWNKEDNPEDVIRDFEVGYLGPQTTGIPRIDLALKHQEKIYREQMKEVNPAPSADTLVPTREQVKKWLKHTPGEGLKESDGKVSYDLDWNFIEAVAKRMDANRDKYEKGNWKKPLEVEKLKEAMCRHLVAIMRGDVQDSGEELGHITAIACNAMMIYHQLNNYPNNSPGGL